MARADQMPGRRRAVPEPRPGRGRLRRGGGRSRPGRDRPEPPPDRPAKQRPPGRRRRVLTALWMLAAVVAVAALVVSWTPLADDPWLPPWVPTAGAVAVTTLYAVGLGVRTGGWPLLSGGLALVLTTLAVLTGLPVLVAAAAVTTAATGAVLGVLVTTPAARFVGVVKECALATFVAAVAALAAEAYHPQVSFERTDYLTLALALLGALVLVYQLGAGVHGLGTRGLVVVVGGICLLAVALAYTEALSRWGSAEMIATVDRTLTDLTDRFGALPRPIEFLLGFPALAWGVSTRARRRQGWWPCAFGAAGLAGIAVSLLEDGVSLVESSLSLGYGAVLGLLLGYLVIRVDTFLSGNRGRRARRAEAATAHRPEPKRTAPLL